MKKSWSQVWKKKSNLPFSKNYKTLLEMNGWDTGVSSFSIYEWKKFINLIIKKFKITKADNVFEIGCGSGAFLLPFYKKDINCFGTDYSLKFIKSCKKLMKKGVFIKSEANNLKKFKKYKFNYVFIHSVFQYFDNIKYADQVMSQLKEISNYGDFEFMGYIDPMSFFQKFCKKNDFSLSSILEFKLKKQSSKYRFNLMIKI